MKPETTNAISGLETRTTRVESEQSVTTIGGTGCVNWSRTCSATPSAGADRYWAIGVSRPIAPIRPSTASRGAVNSGTNATEVAKGISNSHNNRDAVSDGISNVRSSNPASPATNRRVSNTRRVNRRRWRISPRDGPGSHRKEDPSSRHIISRPPINPRLRRITSDHGDREASQDSPGEGTASPEFSIPSHPNSPNDRHDRSNSPSTPTNDLGMRPSNLSIQPSSLSTPSSGRNKHRNGPGIRIRDRDGRPSLTDSSSADRPISPSKVGSNTSRRIRGSRPGTNSPHDSAVSSPRNSTVNTPHDRPISRPTGRSHSNRTEPGRVRATRVGNRTHDPASRGRCPRNARAGHRGPSCPPSSRLTLNAGSHEDDPPNRSGTSGTNGRTILDTSDWCDRRRHVPPIALDDPFLSVDRTSSFATHDASQPPVTSSERRP